MKNFLYLIFLSFITSSLFSQTFRIGFDKRDASSSGGYGQGVSFYSNVGSDVHNVETVYLKGYINMFQATQDKKYLDQFVILTTMEKEFIELKMEGNLPQNDSLISEEKKKGSVELNFGSTYYIADYFSWHKFKTAFEISGNYSIKPYLTLGLGIHYFNLTNFNVIKLGYSGIILNRKIITNYSFIGLPLGVRLHLTSKFINPFLSMEIQPSILLYNRQIESDQLFYSSRSRFERGYFTGFINLGLGANFNVLSSWVISVKSGLHCSFIPMYWEYIGPNGYPIEHKLFISYSSFQIGIGYKF